MASILRSFRLPTQQVPDPVFRPPSNKPLEKDDCCSARTEEIALPILASLVGFVFLPLQVAIAITFVVTVGSVLYYNDCFDGSDGGSAGSKKDVKPEKAAELFKRTFSSPLERKDGGKTEEPESPDSFRKIPVVEMEKDIPAQNAHKNESEYAQPKAVDDAKGGEIDVPPHDRAMPPSNELSRNHRDEEVSVEGFFRQNDNAGLPSDDLDYFSDDDAPVVKAVLADSDCDEFSGSDDDDSFARLDGSHSRNPRSVDKSNPWDGW